MKRVGNLLSDRGEARTVLAMVLVVVLAFGLLQFVAWSTGGTRAFGQGSPSPSGSEFTIQFLNPTQNTSNELSTKNDKTDTQYHLVAWVNKLPPSATVEFKYQGSASGAREVTIGPGSQVGPDTFEVKWDLSGLTDADEASGQTGTSGQVRAILYSSGTEVARDQEAVRINQAAAPSCPGVDNPPPCEEESQAQTIEMVYPSDAGQLGYYRPNPGSGPRNSIFDVTISDGTLDVSSFYTTSLPGSEPTWKACRNGANPANETAEQTVGGIRCEFADADDPASVTAVAVRANDQTQEAVPQLRGADPDSADAHRVFSYEQEVTTVEVTNGAQSVDAGKCTTAMTVTAKDQTGRKIADTNIDVHAAGPSDDLSYDDTDGAYTSPNKPPENHAAESARDCETANNPPFSGSQGEHEVAGPGDIKHIESSSDTNDAGQWLFALHSPVSGANQFTVWADEDSNDRLCSLEAQVNGSVGWGQAAPSATGLPQEDSTCARPNPSGSATPSGSGTGSPKPSGTSTVPPQEQRSLTFTASRARVTAGQRVTFSGQLFAADESCEDNEFIRLTRRVHGTRAAKNFASTRTDVDGSFTLTLRIRTSAEFQAVAPNHDQCADSFSTPVNIQAKAKVALTAGDRRVRRGDVLSLIAKVTPNKRRDRVLLQRQKGRRWVTIDKARLNRRSKATFRVDVEWRSRTFRAKWPSQDDKNEANNSQGVRVRSRR